VDQGQAFILDFPREFRNSCPDRFEGGSTTFRTTGLSIKRRSEELDEFQ